MDKSLQHCPIHDAAHSHTWPEGAEVQVQLWASSYNTVQPMMLHTATPGQKVQRYRCSYGQVLTTWARSGFTMAGCTLDANHNIDCASRRLTFYSIPVINNMKKSVNKQILLKSVCGLNRYGNLNLDSGTCLTARMWQAG